MNDQVRLETKPNDPAGNRKAPRTCLLVLGMHRSGTSALTRVLNLLGASLPKNVLGAAPGNETGYWEPKRLAVLHDELLAEAGSSWYDWRKLDLSVLPPPRLDYYRSEIRRLVEEEYGDSELFVLKDPRITRFVGFFSSALEEADICVRPIITFRNPLEVAISLEKRDQFSQSSSCLVWLRHVLDAEFVTRSAPRVLTSYDTMLADWRSATVTVDDTFDVVLPYSVEDVADQVEQFLSKGQRHSEQSTEAVVRNPMMGRWIADVYRALLLFLHNPESQAAIDIFNRVHFEFDNATPLISGILDEMRQQHHAELKAVRSETDKRSQMVEEIHQQIVQGLHLEISSHKKCAEELKAILAETNKNLEELKAIRSVDNVRWRAEIAQKDETAICQSHALHELYRNTTSWRITSPLRRVALKIEQSPVARALLKKGPHSMLHSLLTAPNPDVIGYIGDVSVRRGEVLLSGWHKALVGASTNRNFQTQPTITISTVTFNSEKWLPVFFDSLVTQNYELELITLHVVDHGSSDSTEKLVLNFENKMGQKFRNVRFSLRPNLGYGAGNDWAIQESSDEYVLVTNVDVEFHPTSIERVVSTALGDRESVASWELRQYPYEHPKYYDPVSLETSWSSHACILFRRAAYLEVGGYEKRIFMYGEDVELSYRFRGAGYILRYVPSASITHHVNLSDASSRPNQLSGSLAANVLLRYRYGSYKDIALGETILRVVAKNETNPERRSAIRNAKKIVGKNRMHFLFSKRPKHNVAFPFSGFDYHLRRDGHNINLSPSLDSSCLPLVTIVTRTHGRKIPYLREAISSVLNQTYRPIEHIVVEDRTDFAKAIVDDVRHEYGANINYVKSNGAGRSTAGNCGLTQASGRYIMFLDNDDLLFSDHVELLVNRIMEEQTVAAYSLGWDVVTEEKDGCAYKEILHQTHERHKQPFSVEQLRATNVIPIQCIIFHRELFERYGGFHEDLEYLEDWNLWVRYSCDGKFAFSPKVTSLYRTPYTTQIREWRQAKLDEAYAQVNRRNRNDIKKIEERHRNVETEKLNPPKPAKLEARQNLAKK